ARLFEAAQTGIFLGSLSRSTARTDAVNSSLRRMFGYAADAADSDIRPFDAERFAEADARQAFLDRLHAQKQVTDYLLKMRRLDGSTLWIEVSGEAAPEKSAGAVRLEAL